MISADRIRIEGDTAWLVVDHDHRLEPEVLDRPCESCDGLGVVEASASDYDDPTIEDVDVESREDCPDCGGTGRHCFTIQVEVPCYFHDEVNPPNQSDSALEPDLDCDCDERTLRVHVVPGMVLPIVSWERYRSDPSLRRPFVAHPGHTKWLPWLLHQQQQQHPEPISVALPSAAAPGMWAVQLQVVGS